MDFESLLRIFKALADQTRLKILYLLTLRPGCVCELSNLLEISQPALTQHLQKLETAKLVFSKRYKNYQIYYLTKNEEFRSFIKFVFSQINYWENDFQEKAKNYRKGSPFLDKEILAKLLKLQEV